MADNVTEILLRARMETSGVEAGVGQIQKSLKGLSLPKGLSDDLEKSFSKLGPLLKDYQRQLNKGFSNKKDLQNFSAIKDKVQETFGEIRSLVQQANSQDIRLKVDTQEISRLQNEITKVTTKLQESLNNVFNSKVNANNISTQLEKVLSSASRSSSVKTMTSSAMKLFDSQDYAGYNAQIDRLKSKILELKTTKFQLAETLGVKDAQNNIDKVNEKITNFFNNIKVNGTKVQHIEDLKTQLQSLGVELDQVQLESLSRGAEQLAGASSSVDNLSDSIQRTGVSCEEAASGLLSMKDQVSQLQTSTQYFFSLRNMINLFRRGVQDAIETVKNLDAAMTETAVVTNFSVGDMWEKLPEYTANANALGATVQDMYESTTLYYQQGLNTEQAMGIAAETMKMARIAGLEAADATDKMTAALRGFNMEITEISAQRINDVYSNLAAKTASNTEELGTAMQRTASIANSAGMSFEGTAAFLAQAIETTREPAENLGTAMKTIVARFQELKKNPLEITEVDGEEVSYNKVDTALQSIGVSLKDANGQFRALDEVFLEISERWDGLTQTQQRYIATTAAGSRQQSRFIAMMSDYERTMQLMDYANNSAGASEEQFGKTLEGLEAKLNRLTNAWNQFLMGIANSSIIKGSVDGITGLLGGINNLIDKISGNNGVVKSVLSLYAAFTGLKAGGKIINSLIGGLGGMVDPASSFGIGFGRGMTGNKAAGNAAFAAQINQPIVAGLKEVVGAINKSTAVEQQQNARFVDNRNAYAQRDAFREASLALKDSFRNPKTFSVSELRKQLGGLTGENQNILMRSNASLFGAGASALLGNYVSNNPKMFSALKAGEKNLNNARKAGQLTAEQYFQHLQDPGLLKDALLRSGIEQSNPAYKYLDELNNQVTGRAAEITKQQTDAIQREFQSFQDSGDYAHLTEADLQKRLQKEVLSEEAQARIRQQALGEKGLDPDFKNSTGGRILQGITRFGGAISQAGMGIQAFGGILMSSANPALQTFGSALTSVGGLISGLGMTISGVGSAFTAISSSSTISGIATSLGAAASTVTGVLFALAAAIGGVLYYFKKIRPEKIKEAGEKVTTNYKEKNDKAQSNISNLESYREDFARLRAGVDESGMNINLDNSDYERWLEITRTIADLNPEIVDGYNAQGNAIINNKNALEETLAIEKERQQTDFETYISPESTSDLIAARNLSRQEKSRKKYYEDFMTSGDLFANEFEFAPQADMRLQAQKIGENLQKGIKEGWIKDADLSDFGITADDLASGSDETVQAFEQNSDKIMARINSKMDSAGDELKDKTKENLLDAFSGYGEASDELEELITPLYEQQLAKIGKEIQVPDEFRSALSQGIKDIVSDANIENVDAEIQKLTDSFSALGIEGSEYQKILDDVETAQDEYAASLEASAYDEFIHGSDGAIDRIEALKNKLLDGVDTTQGYGKAISEFLENQISQLENFTEAGAESLGQALNGMSSQLTEAQGAFEAFQEATKVDYSTAAESMKSIYDAITEETDGVNLHAQGEGDNTFWTGAKSFFGEENLVNKSVADVQNMLKRIEPMLKEGQAGFDAFWTDLFEPKNVDKLNALKQEMKWTDEDLSIDPEKWSFDFDPTHIQEIAEALGYSDEFLTAMLNKGRQFSNIDFMDEEEVRKSLATDTATIAGTTTTNGQQDLYVKDDYIKNALSDAGYTSPTDQKQALDKLSKDGIKVIPGADTITTKDFQNMGIDTSARIDNQLSSLVQKLGDTGQFSKEEMAEYAQALLGDNFNLEDYNATYDEYATAQDNPVVAPVQSIDGKVGQIVSLLSRSEVEKGHFDQNAANDVDSFYQDIYGKKGEYDTTAQKFGSGQYTSKAEYEQQRNEVLSQKAQADDLVNLFKTGVENATNETDRTRLQEYLNKATQAQQSLETYLKNGDALYSEPASEVTSNITSEKDKGFLETKSQELSDIFMSTNMQEAAEQLKSIREEGDLTRDSMMQLNNAFLTTNWDQISQLDNAGFEQLLTTLGYTADEINRIKLESIEPFSLKVDSSQLESYASQVEGITSKQKSIIVNTELNGEEKVSSFLQTITSEFGGSNEVKKKAIIEAEAHMAAGDGGGAADILSEAGFDENEVKQITQQLAVTVDGSIANLSEVQSALNSELDNLNLSSKAKVDLEAKIDTKSIKKNMKGGNIDYSAKVDKKGISEAKTLAKQGASMPIKAEDKASSTIKTIKDNAKKSVSFNVSPNFTGTWTKTLTIKKSGGGKNDGENARGRRYSIPAHQSLSFGAAAQGMNLPKQKSSSKKQLTSLVGEEGFEIGYIPSEQRSVIFGARGPEITSFPSDTVIYPHKQSKEIIRQGKGKHTALNSFAGGTYVPSSSVSSASTTSYGSSVVKQAKKTGDKVSKTAEDTSKAVARVLVWWDNAARRAESIQRRMGKNQKAYENYIKDMRATLETTGTKGKGNAFIANAAAYISEQERQFNRAKTELTALDTGKAAKSQKGRQKQYNKGANNIVQISYEAGKGKKKKTKNSFINTAGYIYYDKKSQSYQVDQKALNRIKNKDQRKATAEAVKKELDDRISKRNAAQDNIQKAQEALDKFAEEMYNTFFSWENELTKIWNLTQKIEQIQARISGNGAFDELLQKRLSTGMASAEDIKDIDLENFRRKLNSQNELLKNRQELITESRKEVANLLSSEDEKTTLSSVNSKLDADAIKDAKASELKEAQKAATKKENAEKAKSKAQTRLNKVNSRIKTLEKKNKLSKKEKAELKKLKAERTSLKKTISNNNKIIKENKTLANQVNARQAAYDAVKNNASLSDAQEAAYQKYQKKLQEQIEVENKARSLTKITKRADGTLDIQFDTEAFERERLNGNITDEAAKAIQEWVKNLEEANSNLTENYENYTKDVTEYYNQLEELQDDWADYGKELTQISEEAEKQKIDKLKKLYDGIKKALDDLLTEVKRKLDERRQQEDNAKTERDISQKQQRLAMLRADTAGGNQVEIAQLEKEIAEAQQNYQRSLEDQLLDKLQQQTDEASKQRERQIELQEDLASSVNNIAQVNEWMERAAAIGNIENEEDRTAAYEELKEEIRGGYYAKNDYDSVTKAEQEDIESDFEQFYEGLIANQQKQKDIKEAIENTEGLISEIIELMRLRETTLNSETSKEMSIKEAENLFNASPQELKNQGGYTFADFKNANYSYKQIKEAGFTAADFKKNNISYADAKSANFTLDELISGGYAEASVEKAGQKAEVSSSKVNSAISGASNTQLAQRAAYYNKIASAASNKKIGKDEFLAVKKVANAAGYGARTYMQDLANTAGLSWKQVITAAKNAGFSKYSMAKTFSSDAFKKGYEAVYGKGSYAKNRKDKKGSIYSYQKGGLADFTGPAWLDGTQSKPELVLNAQDTKNFIALKDVLSHAVGATSGLGGNYGDMTYEININVEKLTSDYDVDKVADRVKKIIVKDASYRNVTQVRKFR